MKEPPQLPPQVCQKCGASNPPYATRCWLCDGSGRASPYSAPTLEPMSASNGGGKSQTSIADARTQQVYQVILWATLGLTLLIGIGLGVQDTGLLVPYLILVGPALLATGMHAMVSYARSGTPRAASLLWTFVWSTVLTVAALGLLIVASIVLLFLWCASVGLKL